MKELTPEEKAKKAIERVMNSSYKAFVKNPSAVNYVILERNMRIYQDHVKNR